MRLSILFFLVVIACVFASGNKLLSLPNFNFNSIFYFFGVIHSIVESNVEDRAKTGAPVTKAPKPTKVPVKTTNSHGAKTTHARKNLNAGRASTKPPVVR